MLLSRVFCAFGLFSGVFSRVLGCVVCKHSSDLVIFTLCRDDFSIQFHYGGNMVQDGTLEIYIGGDEKTKSHFDADRFGFFDLIDEVK